MEKKDWTEFKTLTEKKFESSIIEKCWGFQIQAHTKWNKGLTKNEIHNPEQLFGFKFPIDYVEMFQVFNGFDTPQISIDPDGKKEAEYERRCYMYPNDFEKTKWLIDEVNQNIEFANEALTEASLTQHKLKVLFHYMNIGL